MDMCGGPQLVPGLLRVQEESDHEHAVLRAVLDGIPDPIFLKDRTGRMVWANRAALNVIGKPAEEVLGKTSAEYLEDRQAGIELLQDDFSVMVAGVAESTEQVMATPAGSRALLTTKSPLRDASGNLIGLMGVSRDITEQKAAEAAVRENAERLALIMEATSGGFWDWNIQTGDAIFSPRYSMMLGYYPEEFARNYKSWKDMVHPDDLERVKQHYADHFAGRTDFSIEFRMKEKSGKWHWIHSRGLLIERDPEGRPLRMVGTHSDIQGRKCAEEERQRLQTQLAHAQKMECVGRLAGGIAHDFGNLMSVILLHTGSALEALGGNDPVSESVIAIQEAAEKAVALSRQLLAFSHKENGKVECLDLNSVLSGCEKLVRPLIGERIQLIFDPGPVLPLVQADAGQLYQIIMNFAVNARDAMPDGGVFTIETAAVDETPASIPDARPGPYVRLTVRDTGVGMDPETQARAFEPFFTTKQVGKGTGLGLSVVCGIVNESNGYITVQSEPGKGAEFQIYLPAAVAVQASVSHPTAAPTRGGDETILVAEDEELLRNTIAGVLEHAGYQVLVAADAEQAIRLDAQKLLPVRLLLADVVMPGLSGPELGQYLLQLRPDMRILYMSGYPEAAEGAQLLSEENFIQKPFTAEQLLRRVREVLDRRDFGVRAPAV